MRGLIIALTLLAATACGQEPSAAGGDAVACALTWLAPRLTGDDALEADGANAAGKLDVARALLSLIHEMTPDLDGHAAGRAELFDRVREVARGRGGVAAIPFSSWMLGFAGMPLYERAARTGEADAAMRSLVRGFVDSQNAEGGWGHGGGFEPEFYPTTLMATTNLGVIALGMGRRHDIDTAEDEIESALELVRDVQGEGGGVPYGGRAYRKGFESGRTAGTVVALIAAGETGERLRSAAAYLLRNLVHVPRGHASPAIHVFFGAVACRLLGEEAWDRYDATVLADIRAAQRADGSFRDVLGVSPDTMGLMAGRDVDTAYVTAFYAAALAVPRSKWIAELAKTAPRMTPAAARAPASPPPAPAWQRAVAAEDVALDGDLVAWIEDDDDLTRVTLAETPSGDAVRTVTLPATAGRRRRLLRVDGALHLLALPVIEVLETGLETGIAEPEYDEAANEVGLLFAIDLASGEPTWSTEVPADTARIIPAGDELLLLRRNGNVRVLSSATGVQLRRLRRPGLGLNAAVAALPGGDAIYARGSRLWRLDVDGDELWTRRTRGRRGVRRPRFSAVATRGDLVFAGSTSGRLSIHDATTGAEARPSLSFGASITHIQVSAAHPDLVVVVTGDHGVHVLRDGERHWSHDASGGAEGLDLPRVVIGSDVAWIGSGIGGALLGFDLSGKIVTRLPIGGDAVWAAWERTAIVGSEGRLAFHRME